jgi:hypothetical protein
MRSFVRQMNHLQALFSAIITRRLQVSRLDARGQFAEAQGKQWLGLQPKAVRSVAEIKARANRSKYQPHQGAAECARRRRQMGLAS